MRSTCFAVAKDKPVYRFFCLLNLPPTNLVYAAFFFSLFLSSVCEGHFMNEHC